MINHQPNLYVLGVNHEIATVNVREKAAFTAAEIPVALQQLLALDGILEGVILATCNRCEIYVIAETAGDIREKLTRFFLKSRPQLQRQEVAQFYFHTGEAAVRHLYAVACGLNSMIIGEPQITGQIKDAYRMAMAECATGLYLNRLFHLTFQTAKMVRTQTGISEGAVSVSYAAVKLAQKIFKDMRKRTALLIGTGETGTLVAQHLQKAGIGRILIVNRTLEKAQRLAESLGGSAHPFMEFPRLLHEADLVIGATGARDYLITAADLQPVVARRAPRPLFMIDLGVPRNFDPEINRFQNVFLSDIDALDSIVQDNLEKRREAVTHAEAIISKQVAVYQDWRRDLSFKPTIISLRRKLESLRDAELKKHVRNAPPEVAETAERVTQSLVNKILALPMLKMHTCNGQNGEAEELIHAIHHIFDLEKDHHE
jgi:glutamyl-tRNA reductase